MSLSIEELKEKLSTVHDNIELEEKIRKIVQEELERKK